MRCCAIWTGCGTPSSGRNETTAVNAQREARKGSKAESSDSGASRQPLEQRARALRASLLIALAVAVVTVALHYLESRDVFAGFRVLRAIELKSLDIRFQLRGPRDPGDEIVIVAIDEKSIGEYGRYPWDRGVVARLIDRLASYGAKAIAFDVFYAEPQKQRTVQRLRTLLDKVERAPEQDRAALRAHKRWIEDELRGADEDGLMAASLLRAAEKGVGVCLAVHFISEEEKRITGFAGRRLTATGKEILNESAYPVVFPRGSEREAFLRLYPQRKATGVVNAIDVFAANVYYEGSADYAKDFSGIVRDECVAIEFDGSFYPSLAVQAYRAFRDVKLADVRLDLGQQLTLGDVVAPLDGRSRLLINYCGPHGTFRHFSFSDVAEGRWSADHFKGKAVLVGATAQGIGDFVATPFSAETPGVEKHASVLASLLHREFLRGQWATLHWDLLNVLVLCLVLGVVLAVLPPAYGAGAFFLIWAGYCMWVHYAFVEQGAWRNVTLPTVAAFGCFGFIALYRAVFEERKKRLLKGVFEHYLHPTVVTQIMREPGRVQLGGEEQEMSIYFSDIENFTHISEHLTPSALIAVLNSYFSEMTEIILWHNGLLDKYVGDEIVAAFGPPLGLNDHAIHACMAAIECQEKLAQLRIESREQGHAEMFARIGINSGQATVGNIGSATAKRFNYTIIGDAVNLASRLEAANKEYGTYVMISETTCRLVRDDVAVRELDLIRVPGRDEPVRIFQPVARAHDVSPENQKVLDFYHRGLELYRKREWDKAKEQFEAALEVNASDGPAATMASRCEAFLTAPPWAEWDAVFSVGVK